MAQHDYVIDNASGAVVRADINSALAAVKSTNSGTSAPASPVAGMLWVDTDTPSSATWTFQIHDGGGWISLGQVDTTNNRFVPAGNFSGGSAASPGLAVAGDSDTGIYSAAGNSLSFSTGGVERLTLKSDGDAELAGDLFAHGYVTRAGVSGPYNGNRFNIAWDNTNAALWIDTTNVGTIAFATSDRRLKHCIEPAPDATAIVKQLRPVLYRYRTQGVFTDDGVPKWGFIADEVQPLLPSAVTGSPDGEQPQSIIDRPIVAALTKALQEALARIDALEAQVAALAPASE